MNDRVQALRQTAPHLVIALAVCAGAWLMLVQPKLEAIAQIAGAREGDALRLTPEQQWQLAQHVEEIEAWLDEVRSLNELSRDSSRLFALIMELGEGYGVQVVSVQPGPAPRQARHARTGGDAPNPVSITRLEIVARGRFENVAAFIDSVTRESRFIRPLSLHVSPAYDGPPPTINARIACDILTATPPQALAGVKGVADAP